METTRTETIAGAVRLLFEGGTVAGMSDGQLLDRFLDRRGGVDAAEVAFAALVERHGPMVLRACRARLGSEHDAQDACQATFLILARKAESIRKHESAASWLHGVARRVASCSRRASTIRRAKERKAAGGKLDLVTDPEPSELASAVTEELGDLSEKDRAPLTLCLLDGLTHEEAADRLGWPVGTVKTRVRRAKDRLRVALTRRGLAPSVAAIAGALKSREALAMPASLVRATARLAMGSPVGNAAVASTVATLIELGSRSLIMTRFKVAAVLIASLGTLAAGANGLARQGPGPQDQTKSAEVKPVEKPAPPPEAKVADRAEPENLELVKLDLEILRKRVEDVKQRLLLQDVQNRVVFSESQLKAVRSAKTLDDLEGYFASPEYGLGPREEITLEEARRRLEAILTKFIDQAKNQIKQDRGHYTQLAEELRFKEERLREVEAGRRGAEPGGTTGGDASGEEQRLDQIEATQIDVELLQIEVSSLKLKVTQAMQFFLQEQDRVGFMTSPHDRNMFDSNGMGGGNREPLTGEALERAKKQGREYLDLKRKELDEVRAAYLAQNRELTREQRKLNALKTPKPVVQPQPAPKPAADLESRLSDVEKKLDLILNALDKPGGPAKK